MTDCITIKELTDLLTQDSYYRKLKEWPLLKISNLFRTNRKVNDIFSIDAYTIRKGSLSVKIGKVKNTINERHPYVTDLLVKFKDNLVACGGAIAKIVNDYWSRGDIDLFFYNLDIEEANKMRIEAIKFIINSFEKTKHKNQTINYYINRNEYVTTLYVTYNDDEDGYGHDNIIFDDIYEYQFIHRIYPNISSIIGGFDISACMVAYDGEQIYATPLGTWSIKNKSIIIDTKRRSTSFEYRLRKYLRYGFRLLFPGLPITIINNLRQNDKNNYDNMINKINEIINEHGYKIDGKLNLGNVCMSSTIFPSVENVLPYLKLCNSYLTNNLTILLGTKNYNRNKIENRFIDKISDYDHINTHPMCLPRINAQQLRSDKLHSVCSIIKISNDDNKFNLDHLLINDVNNPNLMFDNKSIEHYKDMTEKVRSRFTLTEPFEINRNFYRLIKYFGKLTPEVIKIQHTDKYYEYCNIIIEKMKVNANICEEKLIGIKWMTQNPGRQWTSSINPIIADPREWYGKHYIPVITGIPSEIEATMRLMRLPKTESIWTMISDDVFNVICMHLLRKYADDAWYYI